MPSDESSIRSPVVISFYQILATQLLLFGLQVEGEREFPDAEQGLKQLDKVQDFLVFTVKHGIAIYNDRPITRVMVVEGGEVQPFRRVAGEASALSERKILLAGHTKNKIDFLIESDVAGGKATVALAS